MVWRNLKVWTMPRIYPVIMCGGSGTRMWPLSRQAKPKQYHALVSEQTMLQETVARVKASKNLDVAPPSFVCAQADAEIIKSQCAELGVTPHKIVLEPIGRNTAPVAAAISQIIGAEDSEGLILLLPADHHISDSKGFWTAVNKGIATAQDGYLTTLGIHPAHAETGYGYIQRGKSLGNDVYAVSQFVEKPDPDTAESYLKSGDFYWNAGIFLFSVAAMKDAFSAHAPDIFADTKISIAAAKLTGNIIYLDKDSFAACRKDSIDYAIMEKAGKVAIIAPVDIGWNDIGSWASLGQLLGDGAESGDVIALDCNKSYIHSDGPLVAAIGLENIIVVATDDAVLVMPADRAQDVKAIVERLKASGRTDLL